MYKVLCVEDEIGFREDIADFLRMKSFDVDEASNGREALQKLEMSDYDLILSDIKMPELDGFGMFKALPKDAPPVIFLSALNDHDTLVEGHQLGCDDFLAKPVNFKVLLAALQHRLKARGASAYTEEPASFDTTHMLANCVQHVLSKPLLQISEAAYYLTSLPEDAPLAKVNPILEMVKDASNAHLEEMSLLQAGLSIPDSLPDTARPMQVDEAFLQMIAGNMPQLRTEVFVEDTANAPTILTQPDWVMRGFTELMRSHTAVQAVGMSTVPCITAKRDEGMVHITLADGGDLLQVNAGYTPLEKIMGSASMCESLAPRMLALLYLHAVAHAHGGTVAAKSDSAYRLAVRLSIPEVTPH